MADEETLKHLENQVVGQIKVAKERIGNWNKLLKSEKVNSEQKHHFNVIIAIMEDNIIPQFERLLYKCQTYKHGQGVAISDLHQVYQNLYELLETKAEKFETFLETMTDLSREEIFDVPEPVRHTMTVLPPEPNMKPEKREITNIRSPESDDYVNEVEEDFSAEIVVDEDFERLREIESFDAFGDDTVIAAAENDGEPKVKGGEERINPVDTPYPFDPKPDQQPDATFHQMKETANVNPEPLTRTPTFWHKDTQKSSGEVKKEKQKRKKILVKSGLTDEEFSTFKRDKKRRHSSTDYRAVTSAAEVELEELGDESWFLEDEQEEEAPLEEKDVALQGAESMDWQESSDQSAAYQFYGIEEQKGGLVAEREMVTEAEIDAMVDKMYDETMQVELKVDENEELKERERLCNIIRCMEEEKQCMLHQTKCLKEENVNLQKKFYKLCTDRADNKEALELQRACRGEDQQEPEGVSDHGDTITLGEISQILHDDYYRLKDIDPNNFHRDDMSLYEALLPIAVVMIDSMEAKNNNK